MVGGWARAALAFDERVFQHSLKGLTGDVAGREGAAKRLRGLTAHRSDSGGLQRLAVERTPGYRFGAAPFDPFLAKVGLAAGEEPQLRAHSCPIVGDEAFEPAIVVAMPVAQNQAVDPAGIEIERLEVPDQHWGV